MKFLKNAKDKDVFKAYFLFYLFIKCMQPKAMTLFTLEKLLASNTLFFTLIFMYLYEIRCFQSCVCCKSIDLTI